jgi:hypothetical protein
MGWLPVRDHRVTAAKSQGNRGQSTSHNTLGVTHGALARACHAAYERGQVGKGVEPPPPPLRSAPEVRKPRRR